MPDSSHRVQIIVALISLVGGLAGAVIANFDKLFGPDRDSAVELRTPDPIPAEEGLGSEPLETETVALEDPWADNAKVCERVLQIANMPKFDLTDLASSDPHFGKDSTRWSARVKLMSGINRVYRYRSDGEWEYYANARGSRAFEDIRGDFLLAAKTLDECLGSSWEREGEPIECTTRIEFLHSQGICAMSFVRYARTRLSSRHLRLAIENGGDDYWVELSIHLPY